MRFWAGWGYPQGRPHGLLCVLNIPSTCLCVRTRVGGFDLSKEHETMYAVFLSAFSIQCARRPGVPAMGGVAP